MRKYGSLVIVLTLFYALAACENNHATSEKSGDSAKVIGNKSVKKKKSSPVKDSVAELLPQDTTETIALSDQSSKDVVESEETIDNEIETVDSDAQLQPDTTDFYTYVDSSYVDSFDISDDFPDEVDQDPYSEQGNYLESGLQLGKEKLIKTDLIQVNRPDYKSEKDSALALVEKRISLKPEDVSKVIVVERWISPVNYRGYKFNRKKLMLYGVEKTVPLQIYYYLNDYFLSLGRHIYYLDETVKNTDFVAVQDTLLENYLLNYDPKL